MNDLYISTDRAELDIPLIHQFLSVQSTWAKGISLALVEQSIAHSLCFGGFLDGKQVAFARVISDYTTFANLVDVFVLPEHRAKGYSKAMMDAIMVHPHLQGLRRFTLATGDAHGAIRAVSVHLIAVSRNADGAVYAQSVCCAIINPNKPNTMDFSTEIAIESGKALG